MTIITAAKNSAAAHSSTAMKPLSLRQSQRPGQLFVHGFRNVTFQIGAMEFPKGENLNITTANYVKASLVKGRYRFPVNFPSGLPRMRNLVQVVASITGVQFPDKTKDIEIHVREIHRPSIVNVDVQAFEELVRLEKEMLADPTKQDQYKTIFDLDGTALGGGERLGRGSRARNHNRVMLTGVIVGGRLIQSPNKSFEVDLRIGPDPSNIIPLVYESARAGNEEFVNAMRRNYLEIVSIEGQIAYRQIPVWQLNDDGSLKLEVPKDEAGNHIPNAPERPVQAKAEDGTPKTRRQHYIRLNSDPAPYTPGIDTSFDAKPKWLTELKEQYSQAQQRRAEARAASSAGIGQTTASGDSRSEASDGSGKAGGGYKRTAEKIKEL